MTQIARATELAQALAKPRRLQNFHGDSLAMLTEEDDARAEMVAELATLYQANPDEVGNIAVSYYEGTTKLMGPARVAVGEELRKHFLTVALAARSSEGAYTESELDDRFIAGHDALKAAATLGSVFSLRDNNNKPTTIGMSQEDVELLRERAATARARNVLRYGIPVKGARTLRRVSKSPITRDAIIKAYEGCFDDIQLKGRRSMKAGRVRDAFRKQGIYMADVGIKGGFWTPLANTLSKATRPNDAYHVRERLNRQLVQG